MLTYSLRTYLYSNPNMLMAEEEISKIVPYKSVIMKTSSLNIFDCVKQPIYSVA